MARRVRYFDAPNGAARLLDRLLYADMKTYLVELLMKQDQMSMAASIESRVPFLDHKLVEFAAGASRPNEAARLHDQMDPARSRARPPAAEILTRPKMGFPVPFGVWMRGPWNERGPRRAARSPQPRARHHRACRRRAAARRHAAGRTDGADAIWSLLNLELWYRTFIDGDGVQTLPAWPLTSAASAGSWR